MLTIKNMSAIKKIQFAKLNDKRYYFSDGILSLPFSHPYLWEVTKYKKESKEKLENFFSDDKFEILKLEYKALLKNERLRVFKALLLQPVTYYKIDYSKRSEQTNFSKPTYTTTKDYTLNSHWLLTKDAHFIIWVLWNSCLRSADRYHLRICGNKNVRKIENLKGTFW